MSGGGELIMFNNVTSRLSELNIDKLSRANNYTTNGYWLIKSDYESTHMRKKATNLNINSSLIDKTITRATQGELVSLTPVKVKELNNILVCELQDSEGTQYFLNAHFLKFFMQVKPLFLLGNKSYKYQPVICMQGNDLIGLIMPLHIEQL